MFRIYTKKIDLSVEELIEVAKSEGLSLPESRIAKAKNLPKDKGAVSLGSFINIMLMLADGGYTLSDLRYTKNGKPYIDGRHHISVSHSKDYVATIMSNQPVGIDIQNIRQISEKLVLRVCSDEEIEWIEKQPDKALGFMKVWCLKEAALKLTGQGIATDLKAVNFRFDEKEISCPTMPNVNFFVYEYIEGYIIAVAEQKADEQ